MSSSTRYGHVIVPERQFIYQVFEGTFTVDQLIACLRALWADPNYSKTLNGITDLSRMVASPGLNNLQPVIAFLKDEPQASQGRWAVITATPMTTAACMVYRRETMVRHPSEVFSTWESACGYLQIDPSPRPVVVYLPEVTGDTSSTS